MSVRTEERDRVLVVTIDRPARRNAVDEPTAKGLIDAFTAFDARDDLDVAVLTGASGTFCAGADLKVLPADPDAAQVPPMGPSHMRLGKPTIAAVEGYAIGGGFELALWCDLRVAATDATFSVGNRRWGLPTWDGGTVRLPRMIGQGRALDLLLTGRAVRGPEAERLGLVTQLVEPGETLDAAIVLAGTLVGHPQAGLRSDRLSALEQWSQADPDAFANEIRHGRVTVDALDPSALAGFGR
jgi:enoyl-CoA hydratase